MKKTLCRDEFVSDLLADDYANWSAAGASALFDYFEDYEEQCDTEIEFDRVAIRCDYSEYGSLEDWAEDYFGKFIDQIDEIPIDMSSEDDADWEIDDPIRDYITERGHLIEFDGGIIVSSF